MKSLIEFELDYSNDIHVLSSAGTTLHLRYIANLIRYFRSFRVSCHDFLDGRFLFTRKLMYLMFSIIKTEIICCRQCMDTII